MAAPPDLTFHKAYLEEFKGGVLTHVGTATNLQYVRDTGSLAGDEGVLKPLSGSMNGGVLYSGTATGNTKTGKADLADGVLWVSSSGDRVKTSRCHLDMPNHTAIGNDPVQLLGNSYRMEADSFVSHFAHDNELYLQGHAHTVITESNLNMDKATGGEP